jgi:hypothetical protein
MFYNEIDLNEKQRLIEFIDLNELDYIISENNLGKFGIISEDNKYFYFLKHNDKYIVQKWDYKKSQETVSNWYYTFNNFSEVLEQLRVYDDSIYKIYWQPVLETLDLKFNKDAYTNEWWSDFSLSKHDCSKIEKYNELYEYLVYEDDSYKPELKSPFNTLHEVSPINEIQLTKIDKLYIEIHPVILEKKKEKYFLKILINNDELFKEYVNYDIFKKKGLKLFLENFFKEMQKFKK